MPNGIGSLFYLTGELSNSINKIKAGAIASPAFNYDVIIIINNLE